MAAAVIANRRADLFRDCVEVLQQVFDRQFLEVGMVRQSLIELGDVGLVMLAMVDLHGLGIDVGLQRIERVAQRGQLVWA